MRDEVEKTRLIIKALIAIVVVLGLVVVYLLVALPAYNSSLNNAYGQGVNYGVNYTVLSILQSIQTHGYVAIPLGNNQTAYLTAFNPNAVGNSSVKTAASTNKSA